MSIFNTPDVLIAAAIFGVFNGIGNAIGTYISNKHVIERIEGLRNGRSRPKKNN